MQLRFARADYGFLYDLRDDPRELVNLWDDAGHAAVKRELMAGLLRETMAADRVARATRTSRRGTSRWA